MKKYVVLCFLIITTSFTSFASIVSYTLSADALNITDNKQYELRGFLAFESEGIIEYEDETGVLRPEYVNFKLYDFFLYSPKDVVLDINDGELSFMTGHDVSYITYQGDTQLRLKKGPIFEWLTERPKNGSLEFAPESFIIYAYLPADDWSPYKFGWITATYNSVDEPDTSTFILYGLLSIFIIAIINKRAIIKT